MMKKLVVINVVLGVLACALTFWLGLQVDGAMPKFTLIFFALLLDGLVSFGALFPLWEKHQSKALVPFGVSVLFGILFFITAIVGVKIGMRDTPLGPDYFSAARQAELTQMAEGFLTSDLYEVIARPGQEVEAKDMRSSPLVTVPEKLLTALRQSRFTTAQVDHQKNVVYLRFQLGPQSFCYIYTKNGQPPQCAFNKKLSDNWYF